MIWRKKHERIHLIKSKNLSGKDKKQKTQKCVS